MYLNELFANETREVTKNAILLAKSLQHGAADLEHVLFYCLSDIAVQEVLQKLNVNVDSLSEQFDSFLHSRRKDTDASDTAQGEYPVTDFLRIAIDTAGQASYMLGDEQILPKHLLLGALNVSQSAACYILNDNGVTRKNVIDILNSSQRSVGQPQKSRPINRMRIF